jgi:hypothetical protein
MKTAPKIAHFLHSVHLRENCGKVAALRLKLRVTMHMLATVSQFTIYRLQLLRNCGKIAVSFFCGNYCASRNSPGPTEIKLRTLALIINENSSQNCALFAQCAIAGIAEKLRDYFWFYSLGVSTLHLPTPNSK